MLTPSPLRLVITTVLMLTSLSLYAKATDREAPWYQFEIIIFERIAKGAGSTEVWPEDAGTLDQLNAKTLRIWPAKETEGMTEPVAYKTLPKSTWRLTEHEQRLRRSRNYRPHLHVAWRQQVTRPDKAQLLYLKLPQKSTSKVAGAAPAKIEGTLKVGVKRYLHLETDLLLRRLVMPDQNDRQRGLRFGPYYQPYRLKAQRRMRSGDLHYIDHPVIGVLFLASKYKIPTAPVAPEETSPVPVAPDATEPPMTPDKPGAIAEPETPANTDKPTS